MAKKKDKVDKEAGVLDNNERKEKIKTRFQELAQMTRAALLAQAGTTFGGLRDVYTALGYNQTPAFADYLFKYKRQDIANRVVSAKPKASWRLVPELTENQKEETELEREFKKLVQEKKIFNQLAKVDKICGIGQFSILFMGFDDGDKPGQPVTKGKELLFVKAYYEGNVTVKTWEADTSNERYGLPVLYTLKTTTANQSAERELQVHWSRIIHVTEETLENDVYGEPTLESIYNRLDNLELITGGSAEMFWRGAFPGLNFNLDADAEDIDLSGLEAEIENYMHNMKRYIKTQGIDITSLAQQVADPTAHVDVQIQFIAAAKGIPKRILTGSERGELASTQDDKNWSRQIEERRTSHCEYIILRPFIDRLIEFDVLPKPKSEEDGYLIEWPNLYSPTEEEKAEVAFKKADTLAKYSSSHEAQFIVPPEIFLKDIMGFNDDQIENMKRITDELKVEEQDRIDEENKMIEEDNKNNFGGDNDN